MKSKLLAILIIIAFTLGIWSCKDTTPTNAGAGITHIRGLIYDSQTQAVLSNAAVYLTLSSHVDSMYTTSDGVYRFEVDHGKIQNTNATITARKAGYVPQTLDISVAKDTVIHIGMSLDMSTFAVIIGTVRDSVSGFPLRNTTVLLNLPGYVDSAVTPIQGSFRIAADLVDRDSMMTTLTIYKNGYRTKRLPFNIYKGRTKDLGNILLVIDQGSTVSQVMGRVFDAQSRLPIPSAMVTLLSSIRTDSLLTSFSGDYSFSIDMQGLPTIQGLLKAAKNGYKPQSGNFNADAGKSFSQDFYLVRDTATSIRDTSKTSLYAHSIGFVSMSAREISVYGVGGNEVSIITWEVRDSLGFPIDIDHQDTVEFTLMGTPVSGGAYVSPARALTNASGRVSTTINSGTVSGALQFIATLRRKVDGVVIRTTPVIITVNAGLPAQKWFSIGADQYNFAGYDWLAKTDGILVQVGDKYSNPVKVGTAVYFNTTGGVITASGFTDASSHASVTLYSGKPLPVLDPNDLSLKTGLPVADFGTGDGYLWVKAQTLGEGSVTVQDSIPILMSAFSGIYVTVPPNLHVDSGGCVQLPVRISDRFGNPLAPGTQMSASVQFSPPQGTNWAVTATGLPVAPLADYLTRGPGRTNFTLSICDATAGGTPQPMPFVVTISVTGPNGNVFTTINGVVGP